MQRYKWVGNLYPDWFREPVSPLEQTWRGLLLYKAAKEHVKNKLGLTVPEDYYVFKEGWLYMRTDWVKLLSQWQILLVPFRFFAKLSRDKQDFEENILPQYKKFLDLWRIESAGLSSKSNAALWQWANGVMEIDTKYAIAIVYIGVYGFFFDFLLERFYRKFVKDEPTGYHELLTGFSNRTHEMNVKLFQLGHIDPRSSSFEDRFAEFLLEFGLEKSDWELALPVLAEHPKSILHIVSTYRSHPELDPSSRLKGLEAKRQKKFEYALSRLKAALITRPIFKWIVRWAQSYVPLRETRQHFIGSGTYFIRQALKLLAGRLGLAPEMIFYLEKTEIDGAVKGNIDLQTFKRISEQRFNLRNQQKERPTHE